jgi:hypothetical protein
MGSAERKKATEATNAQSDIAKTQADLSKKIFDVSSPWFSLAGNYYGDVAKGGQDLQRAVAPQVNAVSDQYTTALNSMKNGLPPGGQRDRAMRDWQVARAGTMSGIYGGGVNDAYTRLASMGGAGMGMGLGGYGSAANTYGNVSNAQAQMASGKSAASGGLASGAGSATAATIGAIAA